MTPAGAASVSQPKLDGSAPLHVAAAHGHAAIVGRLLCAGADATALAPVRGVPCTPLQIASELGHADCVSLLGGGTGMAL